jgi:hypothetical protein
MIRIIIIIIIVIYLIHLFFFRKAVCIQYLTFDEFASITNSSDYFNNMNSYDLQVRKSNNKNEYFNKYQSGYQTFTMEQKKILLNIVNIIEKKIYKYNNFKNIKWVFVKIDTDLENSYPHTIENVIVLSNKFFYNSTSSQINTIIHEKVHIYQRMFPEYINILYKNWGFNKVEVDIGIDYNRNNPDIKYYYSYNNNLLIQLYTNNPRDLYDSNAYLIDLENNNKIIINDDVIKQYNLPDISISKLEHPNEIMAEIISLYLTNSYNNNDKWIIIVKEWMDDYF